MTADLVVIGYGNELRGDDGAGPRVARAVAAHNLPGVQIITAHQLTPEMADGLAEARVVTSETRLARRQGFAPVAGTIQQIYFREGEMVPEKRPVLSIMPPGNLKLRFFVPETELPKLAIGDEVKVTCDNCSPDLTAKIYFIATSAEYTPPVIYSLDERNKLVYLIQARPARPDSLRVGQPVSIYLNPKTPVAAKQ